MSGDVQARFCESLGVKLPGATHLVVGFQHQAEAERFLREFRERLAKFGLELHPDKTRLIECGRFAAPRRRQRGEGKPETFTFLGFTHYCGKNSQGRFNVWRRTVGKRMAAKLAQMATALRQRMHEPVAQGGEWLRRVVTGYYQYHAVPGNSRALQRFRHRLGRMWRQILCRRSQTRRLNWAQFNHICAPWLPLPRVLPPYPATRFDATHPR